MAGNLWGADVAQLRTLAQQFGKVSDTLLQQSSQLSNQINNNPSWKGNDAAGFRSDWNGSHRTLLQQTATRLKQESRKLLENANEQEKASNGALGSGGGPVVQGGAGEVGTILGGIGAGVLIGAKGFLNGQKILKAPFTIAKHAAQYGWVMNKNQDGFLRAAHRVGGPVFSPVRQLRSPRLEGLLKASSGANKGVGLAEKLSDLTSLKNLNKHVPFLGGMGKILEEKPLFNTAGKSYDWLTKGGLARGLGWAGVGFSAFDSYQSFAKGDVQGGFVSMGKTALGVACFAPPPVGTVAQIASAGIAIYENWDTICSVGKTVGDGVANAVKDPGKFVGETGKAIGDAGKSVTKFFGFGG